MKFTILIIDDEKNIREGLAANFELEDYNVKTAASGKEGLELISKGDIDLVITDLRMPGISGEEVLIKVNDELKRMINFHVMNLNDSSYPFSKNQFDVIFCRNVLIYFSVEDQNIILKKLFTHLKIGGTLYLGHSENPQDLIKYVKRIGQNIFIKEKEIF